MKKYALAIGIITFLIVIIAYINLQQPGPQLFSDRMYNPEHQIALQQLPPEMELEKLHPQPEPIAEEPLELKEHEQMPGLKILSTKPKKRGGPASLSNIGTRRRGADNPALFRQYQTLGITTGGSGEQVPRYRFTKHNTEAYDNIVDNPFYRVGDEPLSTFSIDVDTASYSNLRRYLQNGSLPPKDAVRIEEMVNYFNYKYPNPNGSDPFSVNVGVASCPWNPTHRLARIGLKGKVLETKKRPPSNLVFLLDVSGSMRDPNKLPLLKKSFKLLTNQLTKKDRVAIVVYAGASGMVLDSTSCDNKQAILEAIGRLRSGGSTNGGQGIELAYKLAEQHFIKKGINRVILATDGDFNVGVTNQGDLIRLIEEKAKKGVFLTVLGFGMGNYKDSTLEKLADKGNGNYAYIDTYKEARKVFADQINSTLVTIAKDVKIQIEFNPAKVKAYRLIGYENRILAHQDFNDDTKDAGEIGAGHTVTALYQIVPAGAEIGVEDPAVDPLKYQEMERKLSEASSTGELMTVKLRYKQPDGDKSKLIEVPVKDSDKELAASDMDFQFTAAVASFGMLLRDSKYKGSYTYDAVLELAQGAKGKDPYGYRAELINLVKNAKSL